MRFLFSFLFVGLILVLGFQLSDGAPERARKVAVNASSKPAEADALPERVHQIMPAAQRYARKKKLNERYVLLADFTIPSGSKRLFLMDMQKDSCLLSALVTHGRCNEDWLENIRYSNVIGSGCSSPGRYRIGVSYMGRFGRAYKLHGLDSSNSNAFNRYVVLHSHECVPEDAVYPAEICQSDGCPTVSPKTIQQLHRLFQEEKKSILLWILP